MDNIGFLTAAYVLSFVVIGAYAASLYRRLRQARRAAEDQAARPRGSA